MATVVPFTARRDILKAAVATAAGVAIGGTALQRVFAQAQPAAKGDAVLATDLHLLTVAQRNVIALTDAGGVLLVNGCIASEAKTLLDAVATLSRGGKVHTLFNTCWHPDNTGLNEVLGPRGATIIAHEHTRLWLTQNVVSPYDGRKFAALPENARPNKTFYTRESLTAGGKRVEYGHVRASPHTSGDTYVFFPDANVLAVGDAITGRGWPDIDYWTGGWIGGVVGGLEQLLVLANADTRVVPSRGPVLARADLEAQHQMYEVIYERLAQLLNGGRGPDEALAAKPTAEFDAKMGASDEFVLRAFKSLWGFLAPDA